MVYLHMSDIYNKSAIKKATNVTINSELLQKAKSDKININKTKKEYKMYDTPYCKVSYLKEKNAIFCAWKEFCRGDDYRDPLRYGAELIERHEACTWITDTSDGFESDEADTAWLLEEFVPMMRESSIQKIIFIIQKDSPLMDEIMGQKEPLGAFFEVQLVEAL